MSRRRSRPASAGRSVRGLGAADGTPIEDAPFWILLILTAVFWLITFPALVGLLAGWGWWRGNKLEIAVVALVVAALMVAGLATRKPWRRRAPNDLRDERPLFVRFSTWVITALFLPNVLFGVLVLTHEGPPLTYQQAVLVGALISAVQGILAWLDRRKRRRRGDTPDAES